MSKRRIYNLTWKRNSFPATSYKQNSKFNPQGSTFNFRSASAGYEEEEASYPGSGRRIIESFNIDIENLNSSVSNISFVVDEFYALEVIYSDLTETAISSTRKNVHGLVRLAPKWTTDESGYINGSESTGDTGEYLIRLKSGALLSDQVSMKRDYSVRDSEGNESHAVIEIANMNGENDIIDNLRLALSDANMNVTGKISDIEDYSL